MNNKTEAIHDTGAISPWAISAYEVQGHSEPLNFKKELHGFAFTLHLYKDSLWVIAQKVDAGRVAIRVAYSPSGELKLVKVVKTKDRLNIVLESPLGDIMVSIDFLDPDSVFSAIPPPSNRNCPCLSHSGPGMSSSWGRRRMAKLFRKGNCTSIKWACVPASST